jgi:adenylyltransferase/sulfurtransferase
LPNCEANGVLGALCGIIGTMQANEAIKLIAGIGTPLINKLLTYDSLTNETLIVELI